MYFRHRPWLTIDILGSTGTPWLPPMWTRYPLDLLDDTVERLWLWRWRLFFHERHGQTGVPSAHEPLKEAGLSTGGDLSTTSQNPRQGSPLSLSSTWSCPPEDHAVSFHSKDWFPVSLPDCLIPVSLPHGSTFQPLPLLISSTHHLSQTVFTNSESTDFLLYTRLKCICFCEDSSTHCSLISVWRAPAI